MPVPFDAIHWNVRRATLIDVPAVARLIEPPELARGDLDPAFTSATRLVLAHVGLTAGEFWVAADDDGDVQAAAVVLPPRQDAAGHNTAASDGVTTALRLQLGAATFLDLDALADFPDAHWVLLAVAADGAEPVLGRLLATALPAVDAAGLPVLSVHPGRATQVLLEAGFQPWTASSQIPMLIRPAPGPPQAPAPARASAPVPAKSLALSS